MDSEMAAVNFVAEEELQESDRLDQLVHQEPKLSKLLLATACVSLLGATMGATFSFSGVVGPQMTVHHENVEISTFNGTFSEEQLLLLTQSQFSWFASLIILGVIPSNIIGGYISHQLGLMKSLRMLTPLLIFALASLIFAQSVAAIIIARVTQGLTLGLVVVPAMVYVAEISSARWRGTMLSITELFIATGSLLTYILGSMFHWRILALVITILPILTFASSWLILPESPVWLVHQGKIEEAQKALHWFHPSMDSAGHELETLMKHSSLTTKKPVDSFEKNSKMSSLKHKSQSLRLLVQRKDVYHPLLLLLLLFLFQQLSGRTIIPFYAVDLLMDTAEAFNEYVSAILFGLTSVIGQLLNTSLSPVMKRRRMLAISVVIVAASMLTLSMVSMKGCFNESSKGIRSTLALAAVLATGIGYQFGLGPISWNLCNELYPTDVRSLLSGFSQAYGLTLSFLVVKTFPALKSTFGLAWLFLFNGLNNALALLFVLTLLPETKDVRLEHIASVFGKEAKDKRDDSDQ